MRFRAISVLLIGCINLWVLFSMGCSSEERTIRIATKPMTEQYILGEMLALLIEQDMGEKTTIIAGVDGGTANIHPALLAGAYDLYPEYTGTAWLFVLKKDPETDETALFRELSEEYAKQFKLQWVGLYGFNNTFGLGVRKGLAKQYNLAAFSDLAPLSSQLVFGAEYDFYTREDGYAALCKAYGYDFAKHMDLNISSKYSAIGKGEIDVMNIFTTDGQLASGAVAVLKDDRHFYPTYYCGTVVRQETLTQFPKLRAVLMKMHNLLTDADMSRLNHLVDSENKTPRDVARDFLKTKGLLHR